jgi:integrase
MLIDESGKPHFRSLAWILCEKRQKNSSRTLVGHLEAVNILYDWALENSICLESRLGTKYFFELNEIFSLADYAHKKRSDSRTWTADENDDSYVSKPQHAARVSSIVAFLRYFSETRLRETKIRYQLPRKFQEIRNDRLKTLSTLISYPGKRNSAFTTKKALSESECKRLLEITTPGATENPWRSSDVQFRNSLIIRIFFQLGIRRGELAGMRTDLINAQNRTVIIARDPDSQADPRKRQPLTKTCDRELPISKQLFDDLLHYILYIRPKILQARLSPYIFTNAYNGKPISLCAINYLFKEIQKSQGAPLSFVTPHILRHTCATHLAKVFHKNGTDPGKSDRIISELMGWKAGSNTIQTYTRRFIKEESDKLTLKWQNEFFRHE